MAILTTAQSRPADKHPDAEPACAPSLDSAGRPNGKLTHMIRGWRPFVRSCRIPPHAIREHDPLTAGSPKRDRARFRGGSVLRRNRNDTGGSIRGPASALRDRGIKPTLRARQPRAGVAPATYSLHHIGAQWLDCPRIARIMPAKALQAMIPARSGQRNRPVPGLYSTLKPA